MDVVEVWDQGTASGNQSQQTGETVSVWARSKERRTEQQRQSHFSGSDLPTSVTNLCTTASHITKPLLENLDSDKVVMSLQKMIQFGAGEKNKKKKRKKHVIWTDLVLHIIIAGVWKTLYHPMSNVQEKKSKVIKKLAFLKFFGGREN